MSSATYNSFTHHISRVFSPTTAVKVSTYGGQFIYNFQHFVELKKKMKLWSNSSILKSLVLDRNT